MTKVTLSKKYALQWRDAIKGLVVAALSAPVTAILTSLEKGEFTFDWKAIATVAVGSAASYILKNWLVEPAKVITVLDSNAKAETASKQIKDAV